MTQIKNMCEKFPVPALSSLSRQLCFVLTCCGWMLPNIPENSCLPVTKKKRTTTTKHFHYYSNNLASDYNICMNHLHWWINLLNAKSLLFPKEKWNWFGNYWDNSSLTCDSCKWVFNYMVPDIRLSKSKSYIICIILSKLTDLFKPVSGLQNTEIAKASISMGYCNDKIRYYMLLSHASHVRLCAIP